MRLGILVVMGLGSAVGWPAVADDDTARALAAIKSVSREGRGNDDASPAWKTLVSKGLPALMPALEAFDDGNPTAANWLRTAVEAIADAEKAAGRKLPADQLEAFATNTKHAAAARAVAFDLLASQDPSVKARLLPGFINDKSSDLRREAIEFELAKLEKGPPAELTVGLEKLFACARDKDQVEQLAKKLEAQGKKVSVTEHFAFITRCSIIGPFDSPGGKGFHTTYPPEAAKDMSANFVGKENAKLTWKPVSTADKYGVFDLTKLLDKHKDAVAYALAVVVAEKETPCEVRVASTNAIQVFLNGRKLCQREEYHHGAPLDANIGKGTLKKGENAIVLKVCQNDQKEPWAQNWQFQVRVCDATGGPLPNVLQREPNGSELTRLGFIPETAEPKEEKK